MSKKVDIGEKFTRVSDFIINKNGTAKSKLCEFRIKINGKVKGTTELDLSKFLGDKNP